MPCKLKKPCKYPGCPKLTSETYCDYHKKRVSKDYENNYRDQAVHRQRYGVAWQKIRKMFVAKNPFCEECLKNNKFVPVQEVHHKIPLSQGGTNDFSNLQSLCKTCHNRISYQMGDRFGKNKG